MFRISIYGIVLEYILNLKKNKKFKTVGKLYAIMFDIKGKTKMDALTFKDKDKYLDSGILTEPFMNIDELNKLLKAEEQKRINSNKEPDIIKSLMDLVHYNITYSKEKNIQNQKFKRTAKEIWESKFTSGCTDTAIVFATLARQLKIPTTILHTAQQEWVNKLKTGQDSFHHYGHSFCECFYQNKWILVDPTAGMITEDYNSEKIVLNYKLGISNTFLPYFRGLDIGRKMTAREHNALMDEKCFNL